jgi:hypothetical protein
LLRPIARALLPEALGASALPKHFIVITHSNGWIEASFKCVARSETDFDLGPSYEALVSYKKDIVIASEFFNPYGGDSDNFTALHGPGWATLSVTPVDKHDTVHPGATCCGEHFTPSTVTFDRFISKQAPYSTYPFPITASGPSWAGAPLVPSGDGAGKPTPAYDSPGKAYDAWFAKPASVATGGADAARLIAREKSVLDFMRADIARMSGRLAASERARMDQYLEALRGVERQLAALGPRACTPPARPAGADLRTTLGAFVDVTSAAQMCNLTRVSHFSIFGVDGPQVSYFPELGSNEHDLHHMHDESNGAERGQLTEPIRKIDAFILSKVAQMIGNLAKVQEGDGTMLDNSIVMYVNAGGGKHHIGSKKMPVLLAGRGGNTLKTGRYLDYGQGARAISDLYVSVARMLDVPISTFGDPAICKGPLPGL